MKYPDLQCANGHTATIVSAGTEFRGDSWGNYVFIVLYRGEYVPVVFRGQGQMGDEGSRYLPVTFLRGEQIYGGEVRYPDDPSWVDRLYEDACMRAADAVESFRAQAARARGAEFTNYADDPCGDDVAEDV